MSKKFNYRHFNPKYTPNYLCPGVTRANEYEKGDVTYAIMHLSQPYDVDAILLRWRLSTGLWTYALELGLMCRSFSNEKNINNEGDPSERASLALLLEFGLEARMGDFTPMELRCMSPEQLLKHKAS